MTIWSQFRILGRFLGVCVSISLSGKLKIDGQHLVLDVTCCFFIIFSKELFTSQKQHFSINCYKELILFINIIHRYFIFSYAFTVRRTIFYFGDRKYYFDGTNFSLFNTTISILLTGSDFLVKSYIKG